MRKLIAILFFLVEANSGIYSQNLNAECYTEILDTNYALLNRKRKVPDRLIAAIDSTLNVKLDGGDYKWFGKYPTKRSIHSKCIMQVLQYPNEFVVVYAVAFGNRAHSTIFMIYNNEYEMLAEFRIGVMKVHYTKTYIEVVKKANEQYRTCNEIHY
jgi:hypothetical protein